MCSATDVKIHVNTSVLVQNEIADSVGALDGIDCIKKQEGRVS